MWTKVSFQLKVALALLLLLCLLRVHSASPTRLQRHQRFLAAANRVEQRDFEIRPHSVFQDSFGYLWERLVEFRRDSLEKMKFVDDPAVDPARWVRLMTTWIFAPSSHLFQRSEEVHEDGTWAYSIYTDQSYRDEKAQLEHLRVAGRFVGKLLQEGLVLNQRFVPAVYAQLLEPPPGADNLPQGQTLAQTRLAEFAAGVRDVVTTDALVGVERSDLIEFMHGVAFEELADWELHITFKPNHDDPPTAQSISMVRRVMSTLDPGLVAKLWRLVTGMDRVPLCELSKPQGISVMVFETLDVGLGGFDVDPSQRLLYLNSFEHSIKLRELLGPRNFELVVGYYWLKYGMERVAASSDQPAIEVDLDLTSLLEALSPIVEDVARFTASTVIFRGKLLSTDVPRHQFFLLALPRLVGPSCGLFRRVDGPGESRPIVDLCPRPVADEARHLRHLEVAGLVFGKALREFFPFPTVFSDRLYELICAQAGPTLKKDDSEEGTRLDARYAAFVGGIHKVVPGWMLSSLSPDCLAGMFDSSQWNLLVMQLAISRVSMNPRFVGDNWAAFLKATRQLLALLSSSAISPSQLSTLFWHLFQIPISMEVLFAEPPLVSLDLVLSVKHDLPGCISIARNQITISGVKDPLFISTEMHAALAPPHLVALATGKDAVRRKMRVVTARMGHIFQSFFEIYKQEGEEQFIQQEIQPVVVTSDLKEITKAESPPTQAFLILTEVCGTGSKPFVYTLQHGRGSYDIDEGEMEEGEEVHLDKLRLLGIILAQLTVISKSKLIIPLSPRLQRLTYWGREMGGEGRSPLSGEEERPPSPREEAFLGGFHTMAPLDAIQLLPCQEWYGYLDADPRLFPVEGRPQTSHNFLVDLSRTLFITTEDAEEEEFATWEEYVHYVDEHTDDFVVCGYGPNERQCDFIGMAFEEERGLFGVEGGKHVLRESVVEDERKHLESLRIAGLLVGRSIQWFIPVDFALHQNIYFCLKNHGIYPDGLDPSELMRGRIDAFVGGIFAVVSPIALGLLTENEIARLFEWQLPLSVEAIRARHLEPVMEPESFGEQVLDAFWGAIESFPAAAKGQILRFLCGIPCFTDEGIDDTSKLVLGALPTEGAPLFPKINPGQQQIRIPLLNSVETYRTWLVLILNRKGSYSIQRFLTLANISFKERLRIARTRGEMMCNSAKFKMPRRNLFSGIHRIYLADPTVFSPGKWTIKFVRKDGVEEAQDVGGVFREWIRDIVTDILGPDHMLFKTLSASTSAFHIFPEATAGEEKQVLTKYKLAGTIFGKAFLGGVPVGVRFAPIIYMLLLHDKDGGESFDYMRALQKLDSQVYGNLAYVRDNPVDGLDLFFEVHDSEGTSDALIEDAKGQDSEGPTRPPTQEQETNAVTKENKGEYIKLKAKSILLGKTSASVDAFLQGFHAIAPPSLLQSHGFTEGEIEGALYGRDCIDVDEWERATVYPEGDNPSPELIKWFWDIMREFTLERRQQMLFFTTSMSRVPIEGFEGIPNGKFTIEMASKLDPEALPESQTCFSILKLHPYESREKMKGKLEKALDLASKGFGVA